MIQLTGSYGGFPLASKGEKRNSPKWNFFADKFPVSAILNNIFMFAHTTKRKCTFISLYDVIIWLLAFYL